MSYKYLTVVAFRQVFGGEIVTDARVTVPWEVERALWDLMQMAPDEQARQNVFMQAPGLSAEHINEATRAWHGIGIRVRFNSDMRGPYALFTEDEPDDATLVAWAKANVGDKRNAD